MSETLADPGRLAFVDEHSVEIDAGQERVWSELLVVADRAFGGERKAGVARVLGCEDRAAAGARPLAAGSTLVGCRVLSATAGSELALVGRHRFSRYALTFRLDARDSGHTVLRAETRADFPGIVGLVYRTLVIGTRGHVLVVKRMLGAVKRRSERTASSARASAGASSASA